MTQCRSATLAVACSLATLVFPAATQAASHRSHHSSSRHNSVSSRKLPSRGIATNIATSSNVVGRLAIITADSAPIYGGRDRYGRLLSTCPKGQYLAISGENAAQYAVLMVDHTLGYVAKKDVQLLANEVAADPPASDGQQSPASDAAAANDPQNSAPLGPLAARILIAARGYLGVPYVWGGDTRDGIDCSGFVKAVYTTIGISLPRVSGDQAGVGYDVPHNVVAGDWHQWIPGDRLYFACHHPRIDHTAIYIGNGRFIHATASHGHEVTIDPVDLPFYANHLVAVRRSKELEDEFLASGGTGSALTAAAPSTSQPGDDSESSQE